MSKKNPRKTLYIQPNQAAIRAAKRGLEARRKAPKSKRGGLDPQQAAAEGVGSGVARARDIIAGKRVNAYQVKAFFDRHRGNYLDAKTKGLKPEESRAIQAWLIWGGEPLRKQAESAVKKAKQNPEGLKLKIHKTFSKWVDAQKMAKKYPDTFEAPDIKNLKKEIQTGDLVKWNIGNERVWMIVLDVHGDEITGILDNQPGDEAYKVGDLVRIKFRHVYDHMPGNRKSRKKADDVLVGIEATTTFRSPPRKKKRKTKKKSKILKGSGPGGVEDWSDWVPGRPPTAREMIAQCRKLWESYCEKPSAKRLRSVAKHCKVMESSKAKSVTEERKRCIKAIQKEAKEHGWKVE